MQKNVIRYSLVHFSLAKILYNTGIHIRTVSWQGSPEETRRLMKSGLPSHKEISKRKFAEGYVEKKIVFCAFHSFLVGVQMTACNQG